MFCEVGCLLVWFYVVGGLGLFGGGVDVLWLFWLKMVIVFFSCCLSELKFCLKYRCILFFIRLVRWLVICDIINWLVFVWLFCRWLGCSLVRLLVVLIVLRIVCLLLFWVWRVWVEVCWMFCRIWWMEFLECCWLFLIICLVCCCVCMVGLLLVLLLRLSWNCFNCLCFLLVRGCFS